MLQGSGLAYQAFAVDGLLVELGGYLDPLRDTARAAKSRTGMRIEDAASRLAVTHSRLREEIASFINGLCEDAFSDEVQWGILRDLDRRSSILAGDFLTMEQAVRFYPDGLTFAFAHFESVARICEAANELLETLSTNVGKPRLHLVEVSQIEQFGADLSAIHLGCGRLSIWNLNRAIHEFAHLWGEEFGNEDGGTQRTFVDRLKNQQIADGSIARELFADVMATYLAGLAYAYSCLLLDFSPADRRRSDTHPSHDERAHCILFALRSLIPKFNSTGQSRMRHRIGELSSFWAGARQAAGARDPIANEEKLRTAVGFLVQELTNKIPDAGHRSLSKALAVRERLKQHPVERPAKAVIVDVLNGAWLARLGNGHGPEDAIGQDALRMILNSGG